MLTESQKKNIASAGKSLYNMLGSELTKNRIILSMLLKELLELGKEEGVSPLEMVTNNLVDNQPAFQTTEPKDQAFIKTATSKLYALLGKGNLLEPLKRFAPREEDVDQAIQVFQEGFRNAGRGSQSQLPSRPTARELFSKKKERSEVAGAVYEDAPDAHPEKKAAAQNKNSRKAPEKRDLSVEFDELFQHDNAGGSLERFRNFFVNGTIKLRTVEEVCAEGRKYAPHTIVHTGNFQALLEAKAKFKITICGFYEANVAYEADARAEEMKKDPPKRDPSRLGYEADPNLKALLGESSSKIELTPFFVSSCVVRAKLLEPVFANSKFFVGGQTAEECKEKYSHSKEPVSLIRASTLKPNTFTVMMKPLNGAFESFSFQFRFEKNHRGGYDLIIINSSNGKQYAPCSNLNAWFEEEGGESAKLFLQTAEHKDNKWEEEDHYGDRNNFSH